MTSTSRFTVLGLLCVGSLAISACAPTVLSDAAGDEGASGYPISIDNCGFELTITEPPQRIVTIKSTATELVLALGLGERLVATAFPDGPIPDGLALPGTAPIELSQKAPDQESVLAVEPDFILAGWESNLTSETAGDRHDLQSWGIDSYVSPAACEEPAYQPNPLTFEHIFDGILETGALLGADHQAHELVTTQRESLANLEPSTKELTALWYSSGSDIPFVGGGIGTPQLLMDTVGLININAELDQTWASISWEAVAAVDPHIIVLVDSEWNSAEHKISVLNSHPVTQAMTAVQNSQYLTLPFPASEAGVRSVEAAASLAEQLSDLELP